MNKNHTESILWKEDEELGIAYCCPNCKVFLCGGSEKVCKCGQKISWKKPQEYKGRIKWE